MIRTTFDQFIACISGGFSHTGSGGFMDKSLTAIFLFFSFLLSSFQIILEDVHCQQMTNYDKYHLGPSIEESRHKMGSNLMLV